MLSAAKRLNESGGGGARARHDELAIDSLDPGYYTVADGDGQTKAARQAGVDVGRDE
jgi:hypothetical protein